MKYRIPELRGSAFGGGFQGAVAAQFSVVGLYNDSTGSADIRVQHFDITISAAGTVGYYIVQGQINPGGNQGIPAVAGDAPPWGRIQTNTIGALPGVRTLIGVTGGSTYAWGHDWSVCLITPGWSFVIFQNTVNLALTANFWWENTRSDQELE